MKESHTAANIAEWTKHILSNFGISLSAPLSTPTISSVTIDMASNGRKAAPLLDLLYFPCVAHQLNLVLQHAITSVPAVTTFLNELASVTKLLKKSPALAERLVQLVHDPVITADVTAALKKWKPDRKPNKQLPTCLIKPVKTRWSSYTKALRRLIILWQPVWRLREERIFQQSWEKVWNICFSFRYIFSYDNDLFFFL